MTLATHPRSTRHSTLISHTQPHSITLQQKLWLLIKIIHPWFQWRPLLLTLFSINTLSLTMFLIHFQTTLTLRTHTLPHLTLHLSHQHLLHLLPPHLPHQTNPSTPSLHLQIPPSIPVPFSAIPRLWHCQTWTSISSMLTDHKTRLQLNLPMMMHRSQPCY